MTHLSRRHFLTSAAAGAAVTAVFPGVARAQAKPYAGQTLTVFTYAGAYESTLRKHLLGPFEARTGARVVLDPGWWDMLPKLKASPPGQPVFDLVMTDSTQGLPSIKEGLFQQSSRRRWPASIARSRRRRPASGPAPSASSGR